MRGLSSSQALLAASTMAALSAASSSSSTPSCAEGLYMVVARGSEEHAPLGTSSALTDRISALIPGSAALGIDYPATLDNYNSSEAVGVTAMHGALESYQKACPGSKMAMVGYSQGAQVAMDTVCGGIGGIFTSEAAVSSSVLENLVAVAIFGDPSYIPHLAYDKGTSTEPGLFPRNNTAPCLKQADKIRSYCNTDDIYCSGGSNITVHHLYIDQYGTDIVDFVVDKYHAAVKNGSSSAGGNDTKPSGSGSATPSAGDASPTGSSSSPSGESGASSSTASPGKPSPVPGQSAATGLVVPMQSLFIGAVGLVAFTAALL